ncbi:MAG TPA: DUF6036 family nucleotidyltransferase [Verrucomicrobiae bacterium]
MDNPSRILTTLDQHLQKITRLVLFGRAAIYLGFEGAPRDVAKSQDVDVIIPVGDVLADDGDFWEAQQRTNSVLEDAGLYITHLFSSDQVFLRRSWEKTIVPIYRPPTERLQLFRPATLDLILTKMMRGKDAQDLADVEFMVRHDRITSPQIEAAFLEAVLPEVPELKEAFETAQPLVRKIVQSSQL